MKSSSKISEFKIRLELKKKKAFIRRKKIEPYTSWMIGLILMMSSALSDANNIALLIDLNGPVGPAVADYVVSGIEEAEAVGAELVVLKIDTPGGLDPSMRAIIKKILATTVPVVGYVSPSGARAASAGTYILYACHIAAMAPATNLGAATPIQMGWTPKKEPLDRALEQGNKGEGTSQKSETNREKATMEDKIINDATAYIEGLARLRERNIEWAKRAVREGVSLSSQSALENGVIDLMASSVTDLLSSIDQKPVRTVHNQTELLESKHLEIVYHSMNWRSRFLSIITNPNIAYILMLLGLYGLVFEFSNPGFGLPGIVGAIALSIALYAFQALPISYVGLGLILLGIALMIAEAFAPSFGVLGLGGVVAFVVGSILLMDTDLPSYQIAIPIILAFAVFSGFLLIMTVGLIAKARHRKVATGLSTLEGQESVVESNFNDRPMVRLGGELWQIHCDQPINKDDHVIVTHANGVTLEVKKS